MSVRECYDSALIGILQNEGNIVNFLDVFFSFLCRKTDFFRIMLSPTDKYGFRPGVAKKLVLSAFKKYEAMMSETNARLKQKYEQTTKAKVSDDDESSPTMMDCKEVASEVVISSSDITAGLKEQQLSVENNVTTNQPQQQQHVQQSLLPSLTTTTAMEDIPTDEAIETDATTTITANTTTTITTDATTTITNNAATTTTTNTTSLEPVVTTANTTDFTGDKSQVSTSANQQSASIDTKNVEKINPDDDPDLERLQKVFQSNPESYNGAIRDNYRWAQSINDLDVRVKVPHSIRKGKDVKVIVDKKHIKVSYNDTYSKSTSGANSTSNGCSDGSNSTNTCPAVVVVMDGELSWEVHKDETVWSLVPGEHVHINLEKVQERWWDSLLTTEPKISVRKIDPSRPLTDLDDESQAKVEEMMYNDRQKKLGLPQSHEKNMHEILKKAWDAEGSPFKGQPFDPSKVNIAPGSSFGSGGT